MKHLIQDIHAYCEQLSTPPLPVLYELERETHLKTLAPQMLSGRLQGQFLQMLSQLVRPQQVLEIGTFTGYSAICLAQGLTPGGTLHAVEANLEMEYLIRKYVAKAGLKQQIDLHIGDAAHVVPQLPGPFDLVFLDAGKQHYGTHYDLVIDKIRPGGLLLADNVLWNGRVADPDWRNKDEDTRLLHAFNEKVQADERVENVLLPLRDGLLVVRKIG